MNKQKLWSAYVSKNPHWLTGNVTLTPAGLEKLFTQTYDKAHVQGFADGAVATERAFRSKKKEDPLRGLYRDIGLFK